MISFICLNCDKIDPPYDTNHRCLLCYAGSMVVVDEQILISLDEYINPIKDLIKAQAESIKISNMCLGWDQKGYHFDSVQDYIDNSAEYMYSIITSGESLDQIKTKLHEVIQ